MITLITGVPGSGKTLYAVSELAKKIHKEYAGRKIFTHGIPELALETSPIPEGHTIQDLNVWLSEPENHGSIVIIDEAQNVFPPRSSNSKAPEIVEWLHVHRHYGIDLILITQMPQRIDKQVRDLVGAHYHIHQNALGMRVRFFWDYCANNPNSESRNAQFFRHTLDKKAFKLYKSSSLHTNMKKPRSKLRYIFPIAVICSFFFMYLSYKVLSGLGGTEDVPVSEQVQGGVADVADSAADKVGSLATKKNSLTETMFEPTIPDKVESKPLYDAVRQVRTFEYPVACISGGNSGCTCYTHQGTAIKEIERKTCETYVKDGLPFNPYKDERHAQNRPIEHEGRGNPSPVGEVLVMGGKPQQNLMYDGYIEAGEQFR